MSGMMLESTDSSIHAAPRMSRSTHASEEIMDVVDGDDAKTSLCATIGRLILTFFCSLFMLIPIFWFIYIKVVDQYERLVHFRLGKVQRPVRGPGIIFFIPFIDTWRTVDLRITTLDVPSQEMMTKDSVTCHVNAVVYFFVRDALRSVLAVRNHTEATTFLAQTTLRSIVGESELDELLQKRDEINHKLAHILDRQTDVWGVKVTNVEVKDVRLPEDMQRTMGAQAEAERERRAKVISAEGELQASETLLEAASKMTENPATMQLRYLQTLTQLSVQSGSTSTIVFPMPVDMMAGLSAALGGGARSSGGSFSSIPASAGGVYGSLGGGAAAPSSSLGAAASAPSSSGAVPADAPLLALENV